MKLTPGIAHFWQSLRRMARNCKTGFPVTVFKTLDLFSDLFHLGKYKIRHTRLDMESNIKIF